MQRLRELGRLMRKIGHLAIGEEHVESAVDSLADHARILIFAGFNEVLELKS